MKNYLPALVTLAALVGVALTWRAPRAAGEFDTVAFGRLPTLVNGRLKPLDTVARTSLLMLQGRQRVAAPDGAAVTPAEWLLDVLYRPERADAYQVFEIVHPEVLALAGLGAGDGAGGKRFSLTQLRPRLPDIDRQARLADDVESAARTTFQRAVVQLRDGLALYQRLQASLVPPGNATFLRDSAALAGRLPGRPGRRRGPPEESGAPPPPGPMCRQRTRPAGPGRQRPPWRWRQRPWPGPHSSS